MEKTIREVRYANALYLRKTAGGVTEFAKIIEREQPQASSIVGDRPIKGIGDRMARHIEERFRHARGWLDQPHPELWGATILALAEPMKIYGSADGGLAPIVESAHPNVDGWWQSVSAGPVTRHVRYSLPFSDVIAVEIHGDLYSPRIRNREFILLTEQHTIGPGDEVVVTLQNGLRSIGVLLFDRDRRLHLGAVSSQAIKTPIDREEISAVHYVAGIAKQEAETGDSLVAPKAHAASI